MSQFPPALIFINSDFPTPDGYQDGYINPFTKDTLITQLYLDDVITLEEFTTRILALPNYVDIIHQQNMRVLVVVPDFHDISYRDLADVVLFYSHGLVSVEKNNYGVPGQSYPLERINIYELLRANHSGFVVILPYPPQRLGCLSCGCQYKWGPRGIVGIELRAGDPCGVHAPNCDNERNNIDFINRK